MVLTDRILVVIVLEYDVDEYLRRVGRVLVVTHVCDFALVWVLDQPVVVL